MTATKPAALVLALLLALSGAACKKKEVYGKGLEKKLKDQKAAEQRLGEILKSPDSTSAASPAAVGAKSSPPPANAAKEYFDVTLTNDSPFFAPNPSLQVRLGTVLRVTNKDDNPREFKSVDGTYDSGQIAPGKTVEVAASSKGEFDLEDKYVPFAQGHLQVY